MIFESDYCKFASLSMLLLRSYVVTLKTLNVFLKTKTYRESNDMKTRD